MIDLDFIEKQCPKCGGLGKTLNPAWYPFWVSRSNLNNSFPDMVLNMVKNATLEELDEPKFYVCKECNGRGKILTDKVRDLLEYILS
jgi:hypothetical protein